MTNVHAAKMRVTTDDCTVRTRAILATSFVAVSLSYMNCSASAATAFTWFTSLSGIAFLTCWPTIIASNWRWRAGIKAQGLNLLDLKYTYKASFRPWLPALGFASLLFMLACHIYVSASPVTGRADAEHWFQSCIGIPLMVVLFAGYKVVYKTKFVTVVSAGFTPLRREQGIADGI